MARFAQQSSGSIEFYELKFIATSKTLFHRNRPSSLHKRARSGAAPATPKNICRKGGSDEFRPHNALLCGGARPVRGHCSCFRARQKSSNKPIRRQGHQKTSERFRQRWLQACISELDDEVCSDFERHSGLQRVISAEMFRGEQP